MEEQRGGIGAVGQPITEKHEKTHARLQRSALKIQMLIQSKQNGKLSNVYMYFYLF